MTGVSLDPVRLGLIWRRLDGIVDQAAETFIRAAFSAVVRDNSDMTFSLFDARGRKLTQSKRSIPSFMGTLPRTLQAALERFPADRLAPGDTIISNDPWIGTGHLNDISMIQPLFREDRLVAFAASTAHTEDIGGAPSPTARDRFEEGLCIPICKVVEAGRENPLVIEFLQENLREPHETLGDIRAQFAAYRDCGNMLARLLDDEGIENLDAVADEIIARSEHSMRAAIENLPNGRYTDELLIDGVDEALRIRCAVNVDGDRLTVDFSGTSPQVRWPINSVLNYTQAYSRYAVKCLLDPEAPNNAGTLALVTITAPSGCLLNAESPAPVWNRHLAGHYTPPAIFGALAPVLPDRVTAESGAPLWVADFAGRRAADGAPFVKLFQMNGGHGAKPHGDGPGCLSFPTNISNRPLEAFEHQVPLLATEKALVPDTGGVGRFRGGNAQRIGFRSLSPHPVTVTFQHERVRHPPRGLLGGGPGSAGRNFINGKEVAPHSRIDLESGDVVTFQTAGGGGLHPPAERGRELIARDLENGLVSADVTSLATDHAD